MCKKGLSNAEKVDETQPLLINNRGHNQDENSKLPVETNNANAKEKCKTCCNKINFYMEPVIMLYMAGVMGGVPLITQYLYCEIGQANHFTCSSADNGTGAGGGSVCPNSNISNSSIEDETLRDNIQSEAAKWMLYMSLCSGIPGVLTTLLLGPYSDKKGRKVALILPLIGAILKAIVVIVVINFNLPKVYFLIGSTLDGLLGSWATVLMACISYVTDISSKKYRVLRILLLECAIAFGIMLASIGFGLWIKSSFIEPLYLILAMFISCLLYVVFVVPETVKPSVVKVNVFSLESLREIKNVFCKERKGVTNLSLLFLLLIILIVCSTLQSTTIDTLYELNSPFCWTSEKIGYFNAVSIAIIPVSNIIGLKIFITLGLGSIFIAVIGAISGAAKSILFMLATTEFVLYLSLVAGMFRFLVIPVLRATMSNIVSPHEQGALFAGVAIVESSTSTLGSLLATAMYSTTVHSFAGATYLFWAALFALGALLLLIYRICFKQDTWKDIPNADGPDKHDQDNDSERKDHSCREVI